VCDVAEVAWGALEDRRELLRLTALSARASAAVSGKDIEELQEYVPPSEALSDWLRAAQEAPEPDEPEPDTREAKILQFVRNVGGEVG
jgi:hypothetical protein